MKQSSLNKLQYPNLIMGTAQIGMKYGITNISGIPSDIEAKKLLDAAIKIGITTFDTARAYGKAEERLGKLNTQIFDKKIKILTKLSSLSDIDKNTSYDSIKTSVIASVNSSLYNLKNTSLDVLMLHRTDHIYLYEGTIWKVLKDLKRKGLIKKIGVSVETFEELKTAFNYPEIEHIQLPINILDDRWSEVPMLLESKEHLQIHARSIFLQGLLADDTFTNWPKIAGFDYKIIKNILIDLQSYTRSNSIKELALRYVRGFRWIDGAVIGVLNEKQLDEIYEIFKLPPLTDQQIRYVQHSLPKVPNSLLNPSCWRNFT